MTPADYDAAQTGAALFDDAAPRYLALLRAAPATAAPAKRWRLWK